MSALVTGNDTDRILNSIRRFVRVLRVTASAAHKDTGLTAAQLTVLETIAGSPGLSLTELAERTCTDPSSVSIVVSRLRREGLVSHDRSLRDSRRLVLTLTEAGQAAVERAGARNSSDIAGVIEKLSGPQREIFVNLLEHFVGELDSVRSAGAASPIARRMLRRA